MQDSSEIPGGGGGVNVQPNQLGGPQLAPGGVDVTLKGLYQTGPATLGSGVSIHPSHQNDESVQLALQRIQELHNMSLSQLQNNLNMKTP